MTSIARASQDSGDQGGEVGEGGETSGVVQEVIFKLKFLFCHI